MSVKAVAQFKISKKMTFVLTFILMAASCNIPVAYAKRTTLAPRIRRDQDSDTVLNVIEELEKKRNACTFGRYYSWNTKTCESCEKHCPNGDDIELCGEQCIVYYIQKANQKAIYIQEANQRAISEVKQTYGIVIGVVVVAFVIVVALIFRAIRKARENSHSKIHSAVVTSDVLGNTEQQNRQNRHQDTIVRQSTIEERPQTYNA